MKLAMSLDNVTQGNLQFANQIGITDLVVSRPVSLAAQGEYDDSVLWIWSPPIQRPALLPEMFHRNVG